MPVIGFLNGASPAMVALNHIDESGNRRWAGEQGSRGGRRSQAKLWVAVGIAIAVVATAWLAYSYRQSDAAASTPAALPQVVVSKPLEREVDSRLGFLGQFSAVEQVELRAQVGGRLPKYTSRMGTSSIKAISSLPSTRAPTKSGWHRPKPSWRQRTHGSCSLGANYIV